jgi:uncharacterized protein
MFYREQLSDLPDQQSIFFWGARQTGKSTLLKSKFPNALYIDLLQGKTYRRLLAEPELLQELINQSESRLVIIDEIQKIPALLDEVHWLIENKKVQFILSGSSPRRILRSGANLLGGRALRLELYPLSYKEIGDFDLEKAINRGLLPRHYVSNNAKSWMDGYISSYLEDEIVAETKIRNVDVFARFLNKMAFSNGEMINYTNIAQECGVSTSSVREYVQILKDTMLATTIEAYQVKPKRRIVTAPKFYFFDIAIANHLLGRQQVSPKTPEYGLTFEHFIYHELKCYAHYSGKKFTISYWRTTSGFEVDFILGNHEVAIEVKSSDNVGHKASKNLLAFKEEYDVGKMIIVCQEDHPRLSSHGVMIMPWRLFLDRLWTGEYL